MYLHVVVFVALPGVYLELRPRSPFRLFPLYPYPTGYMIGNLAHDRVQEDATST